MTIQLIDPTLCRPNRYQPADRIKFRPEQLADLESIKEKLLYPPKVRPDGDGYEICYGHRRTAAWILYRPSEPMPADVCELSDWDLFAEQAIENGQRVNLNAIQKAQTIATAIKTFHKTQAEAGKLMGLTTQGAVSHLLSLLKLPQTVQAHIAAGRLPERIARQLVKNPRAAEIANIVAAADAADKDQVFKKFILPSPAAATSDANSRKEPPMSNRHKSAHAVKPAVKPRPAMPPAARREIVSMAQAAAAAISPANPRRDVILRGIRQLCATWKVSLPADWDEPAGKTRSRKAK